MNCNVPHYFHAVYEASYDLDYDVTSYIQPEPLPKRRFDERVLEVLRSKGKQFSAGSTRGMKVGGMKELSPKIVESTIGIL